ncbi:hypothetical protein [Klebsiella quasipneumoniae]|uniref:hypothetical protein n=1 Tax=Klebsiella quasipneumoniae TaxID=1463165 RepID=UPI00388E1968
MHLVAGETRAGQQVSQCGLRIFLIAGRRERERLRTVAQNLQQARRRRQVGVVSENGIYGHSRFCNTDFDDKLACLNLSGV